MVKIEYSQGRIDNQATSFIKIVLILLFLASAYKFVIMDGNAYILLSCLFFMIIILSILVALYHWKDIIKDKNHLLRQTQIDEYFRKIKLRSNC